MDLTSQYIRANEEVIVKAIDEKTVLLNAVQGTYYSLNKTGTLIWSFCDRNKTVSEIAGELVNRYSVSGEKALADTMSLVEELLHEGLISISGEKSG